MEYGVSGKTKFIDICKIYDNLGESVCKALAGFHATSGCDYTPTFYKKRKKIPFKVMLKSEQYRKAFYDLRDTICEQDEVFQTLETFVCNLYGMNVTKQIPQRNVNDVRFALFNRQYKVHDIDEPFAKKKLKNLDASSLPPCHSEL